MTLWGGIKKFVGGVWGDPTATQAERGRGATPDCPQGHIIDPETLISYCIGDLKLDIDTNELITPAEAERRRTEGLVWDDIDEEWLTPAAANERRAARRTARLREEGKEVYDAQTGTWVSDREYERRVVQRAGTRSAIEGTALLPFALPNLSAPAADKMQIISGVATLGGESAAVALGGVPTVPKGAVDVDPTWLEYLKGLTGPERRDEEGAKTQRLVILGGIAAVLTAIALTRSRG